MSARNPQTLSGAGRVKTPHLCKMLVAALCCAAGFTLVSDGGVYVPFGERALVHATNDMAIAEAAISGTLIKDGGGALSLAAGHSDDGVIRVESGDVTVTRSSPAAATLPSALSSDAYLWLDAGTHVSLAEDDETVVAWLDVRESGMDGTAYPRAVVHGDEPGPLHVSTASATYLDFGALGSGRWLKWVDASGEHLRPLDIRHVFLVTVGQASNGVMLGDYTWWDASNYGGKKDFVIDFDGQAWWSFETSQYVRMGLVRLDRVLASEYPAKYPFPQDGTHLWDIAASGGVSASNFFNDRNLTLANHPDLRVDRQGGGKLCEVLVFTRKLTEEERVRVVAYLEGKWMGASETKLGGADLAADSTLTVNVASGEEQTVGTWNGLGTLAKTGVGTLNLAEPREFGVGNIRLDEGTVRSENELRIDLPFILAEGGQALAVSSNAVARSADANAERVRKTGVGVLPVAAVSNVVKQIDVEEGVLRFVPQLSPTSHVRHVQATIPNPSFEAYSGTVTTYSTGTAPTDWTITQVGSNGKGGLTTNGDRGIWVAPHGIPDGNAAVFLQFNAIVSTTVHVPVAGRYRLDLMAAARYDAANYRQHSFRISIGGRTIGVVKTSERTFSRYMFETPELPAGDLELKIEGLNATQNRSSVIDDFSMTLIEPANGRVVAIKNAGFEYSALMGSENSPQNYSTEPTGADWTFSEAGIAEVQTENMSGTEFSYFVPEGRRCAYVRNGGAISQDVTFPVANSRYRLTFLAARRPGDYTPNLAVFIDDAAVMPSYPIQQSSRFREFGVTFSVSNNVNARLRFVGDPAAKNTLLDSVRIERVVDAGIPDGETETDIDGGVLAEFETSGYYRVPENSTASFAGWQLRRGPDSNGVGVSCTNSPVGTPMYGRYELFMHGKSRIWRTLVLPRRGVYRLSLQAAGRRNYTGHVVDVFWRGDRIGSYVTKTADYQRETFRLIAPQDGAEGELAFIGQDVNGIFNNSPAGSRLDEIHLELMPDVAAAETPDVPRKTALNVRNGAKVDLAFDGVLNLRSISFGGRPVSGILTAASHPDFVTGGGSLYAPPSGTMVIFK